MRIHHGSCNVAAHVAFYEGKDLAAGEHALGQLRLEKPSFVFAGATVFIVRDWAEQSTMAGGVVLDPDASRRSFRNEARLRTSSVSAENLPRAF